MQEFSEDDDEKKGEGGVELEPYQAETDDDPDDPDDSVDPDNSVQPRCCRPGHCCNITCVLKHYGAAGYSLENSLLYTNTGYQFLVAEGVFESTVFLVFAVIALVLITVCLTSANYPSNRNIVGRLLTRVSCLARYEIPVIAPTSRNLSTRSKLTVNAVFFAILRVLIPSISVYRITKALLNKLFSLESPILIYIIVVIIAILGVPFALAFYDEGNNDQTMLDPDATFVEESHLIAIPEDVELDHQQRFSLAIADPSSSRFENEAPAQTPGRTASRQCISPQCIIRHLGSAGYSIQNAALNYDTAYRFCKSWGWMDAQTVLTSIGLGAVTSSIAAANYFSADTLLAMYLRKFFNSPDAESGSAFERFKGSVGKVNGPAATFSKVSIATVNFFNICRQVLFGSKPAAAVLTIVITPASLLATAGLFNIKAEAKRINSNVAVKTIEVLPDDPEAVELDDAPVDRWSMRQQSIDEFN